MDEKNFLVTKDRFTCFDPFLAKDIPSANAKEFAINLSELRIKMENHSRTHFLFDFYT